jgi:hypothetical protein
MRLGALAALLDIAGSDDAQTTHWYRGNTHTHSANSDGDSPPDSLARWYRDHGYSFLFITDHEKITDPGPLNARFATPNFLLIRGEEVTQRIADPTHADTRRQAHVTALGLERVVLPQGERGIATGITMADGYAKNIAAIRAAGGIPQVNHPNWRWSVRLSDVVNLPDSTLFEIANAHVTVNNAGSPNADGRVVPSAEALWDSLLTRGKVLFAVGDDDAHSFKLQDADDYELTRPGRSWIMVRAETLSAPAILGAIRRGDFYASTGVTIADLVMNKKQFRLTLSRPKTDDRQFVTEFVGRGGKVLATVPGLTAEYSVRGNEGYVRARVTDSNGRRAWTQALWVQ